MKKKPIAFRLTDDDIARLEVIKAHYGLASSAAAVRFAVKAVADKVPSNKRPKAP